MGESKRRDQAIGNMPVEERYRYAMREVAKHLDRVFNGDVPKEQKHTGFVLMVFPLGSHGDRKGERCNYISNSERTDVKTLLREQLAYFEGQAEQTGTA